MTPLSSRTDPHEAPPYRTCAACGESEEDHFADRFTGNLCVFCRCDTCGGRGEVHRLITNTGMGPCPDCDGTGYSDERFTSAVRDE